ncbi:saccharopine dehydrogenase NADP-binding domain-containing protein [Cryptosporangium minutisporangium]|uniref:Saccharopine dehydrogenase NADP-binding domain-containing protein n=1 Tax=Cryptosporangium minutisporangium TaxID=113569 RepID=A0ABP6SVE9_9ACTN
MSAAPIAIYGATGHTGRLVATEILARGHPVVLGGRDATGLIALAAELGEGDRVTVRPAALTDRAALRAFASSAPVLIHCAGPYSRTGAPVVAAAIDAGTHYVDHAVEARYVKTLFDAFGTAAERAGVLVCPGLSFYGGFGDLLAAAATRGRPSVEKVTVGYAVSGWRLTTGARDTADQLINEVERITFTGGTQRIGPHPTYTTEFVFPPPLGSREMIGPFPTGDAVTIPRHVPTRDVEVLLTAGTFAEPEAFTSEHVDAAERARTAFTVAVDVRTGGTSRSAHLTGHDLWWAAAVASVEGALDLALDGPSTGAHPGPKSGVCSPAEVFPADPFLRRLEELGAFVLTVN